MIIPYFRFPHHKDHDFHVYPFTLSQSHFHFSVLPTHYQSTTSTALSAFKAEILHDIPEFNFKLLLLPDQTGSKDKQSIWTRDIAAFTNKRKKLTKKKTLNIMILN